MNKMFEKRLSELGMIPVLDKPFSPRQLFFVADKEQTEPVIRIALENAESHNADAVFFRIFPENENRSPLPQLYIYNRTGSAFDSFEFGLLQRNLWNAGVVPLVAVLTVEAVKLFSCRREPELENDTFVCRPFKVLENVVAAEQTFLWKAIASGTLWEDPRFADDFSFDHSAHKTLLDHLREFKDQMFKESKLAKTVVKRVLVLAILLKYLDERKDSAGNGVFPTGFFSRFNRKNIDLLVEIFRYPGACIRLFDALCQHFNGGIFKLSNEERKHLKDADLYPLADFLAGAVEPNGQGVFWPLYSFNDLPVELISNIYEEFLAKDADNNKGIVYTPPILVEFLLEQCLPLDPDSLDMKILDPACGSGVFLVGAFRRLVHCWRIKNSWLRPEHTDLKRILRKNLFGIDIEEESVLVTAFSLCVALCDELEPKVIWEKLKFDDLRSENLMKNDFFEVVQDKKYSARFDLIVGNPPFNSELTTKAARGVEKIASKQRPGLPDKQLALLFLDQSFNVCRTGGDICLLQPAGPLLYNSHENARDFRRHLFDNYDIHTVFDFTPLEAVLFKANVASAALLARNCQTESNEVLHLIFRRTHSSKDRVLFAADYYDFHWLGRDYIKDNPYAWKVNLLGGGRLHRLVERFVEKKTLGQFLEEKQKVGWVNGEGYTVGCGRIPNIYEFQNELKSLTESEIQNFFKLKRKPKRAEYLTGKTNVHPEAITVNGIEKEYTHILGAVYFQERCNTIKSIFQPPHVLIREVVRRGNIPAVFSNKELVFATQVYGIHAPENQVEELKDLAWRLSKSELYAALLAATSSRYLVGKATSLLANDLMSIPYPERSELKLTEWEQQLISDILNYLVEFRHLGEKATVLSPTDRKDLQSFGKTYCQMLNRIYKNFSSLKPIHLGNFICYPFCSGESPQIELPDPAQAEKILEKLCQKQQGARLFINRIIRLYEKNLIFMIKPDQKRFWLRSVAQRDADETIAELIEAGF